MLDNGFHGELYPVNPNADFIGSPARASADDVPARSTSRSSPCPREQRADVARECAAAGVAALVVITAGFAEAGVEGAARLAELLDICRASGMRLRRARTAWASSTPTPTCR